MITPIGVQKNVFQSKPKEVDNKNYNDPLLKWPLRGAAFSNEVGEALRPIIKIMKQNIALILKDV